MSFVHVASPAEIRPRHVAVIVLVLLTLLGACLLTSGAQSNVLPDGAREWPPDSLFRVLVELLNLHYRQPTPLGIEVKSLVFGLGIAATLATVGIALSLRPRGEDEIEEGDTVLAPAGADPLDAAPAKKHISPVFAAQVLMLLYVAWSFAGIWWSDAKDIALYGSIELAIFVAWPFALAYGLNRSAFRYAAYGLIGACAVTALMAVLYYMMRNPTLRASYPIGNPLFLAACLIPGLLLAFGVLATQARDSSGSHHVRRAAVVVLVLASILIMGSAFNLTGARSSQAGLIAAACTIAFLCVRGRARLGVLALSILIAALGAYWVVSKMNQFSPTGRDATLRERYYNWSYALDLIGESKLLGHGQGGYTRKADALAAGQDVLDDPGPLTAQISHAHNEWLEVLTDLGSIGLVLVAGSLLLTFVAGMTALPALSSMTQRWLLIAMLASLVALAVEECADHGLRVAGLPTLYYTVIGLIWAACMPDRPALERALRRKRWTRGATATVGVAAAAAVAYFSFADFRAARAEYEVGGALNDLRWEEAVRLAEEARTHRLNPYRRLDAQQRLCATFLQLARVHQVNGLRRIQAAMQSDPPDEQLLTLGQHDAQSAEDYRRRGMLVLGDLARKAPNYYNSNWLEYEFEQVRAIFAHAVGDAEAARQFDQNSAVALQRELKRRPYDVNMAGKLVLASASTMSVEEICRVLALPLRHNRVPPLYHEIAARALSVPAFMEKFAPIYAKALTTPPQAALEQDPLAPETLRLAAVIWFEEGEPDVSERALASACALYDALPPRFALAAAACFAELAERRFMNSPTDPHQALRDAEEAIKRAPPSNEGRHLIAAVKDAQASMRLAGGDETAARALLLEIRPGLDETAMRESLSARYAALAAAVMQREADPYLEALRRWVQRAIELDERNAPAWHQKAEVAFRDNDDAECVRCLRMARQWGAGVEFIHRFVDLALSQRPTSPPLLQYRDELAAEMNAPGPPQPISNPASPLPLPPSSP